MNRHTVLLLILGILVLLDFYVFQALRTVFSHTGIGFQRILAGVYWAYTIFCIGILLFFAFGGIEKISSVSRNFLLSACQMGRW